MLLPPVMLNPPMATAAPNVKPDAAAIVPSSNVSAAVSVCTHATHINVDVFAGIVIVFDPAVAAALSVIVPDVAPFNERSPELILCTADHVFVPLSKGIVAPDVPVFCAAAVPSAEPQSFTPTVVFDMQTASLFVLPVIVPKIAFPLPVP